MPFLIRIILQRLLVLAYSFLAFLGIAPEANILTDQEAQVIIEQRRESIVDFFNQEETQDKVKTILDASKKIKDQVYKVDVEFEGIRPVEQVTQTPKTQTAPQQPLVPEDQSAIEDVVVNIVCSQNNGNLINVSTGSGVIIDPKGIVATNAHVGQFVLIEDYATSKNQMRCALYKENIPTYGYTADVLFISPNWINENYKLINSNNPRGTGENDYAFLYINGNTNPSASKPNSFPRANFSLDKDIYEEGSTVYVAGYPGAPKNIVDIARSGVLRQEIVSIIDVFTFKNNSIDIISTSKSDVGARGASGGGVFDTKKNLIAIITTTTGEQNNAEINAITTSYINKSLEQEYNKDVVDLTKDPVSEIQRFRNRYGDQLADILLDEMN